jgi:hypothetical protein
MGGGVSWLRPYWTALGTGLGRAVAGDDVRASSHLTTGTGTPSLAMCASVGGTGRASPLARVAPAVWPSADPLTLTPGRAIILPSALCQEGQSLAQPLYNLFAEASEPAGDFGRFVVRSYYVRRSTRPRLAHASPGPFWSPASR